MLVQTLLAKVETLANTQPTEQLWVTCQNKGLIDSQGVMPFLRWNEKAKKLEPSKEPGIQIKEIANNLQQLNRLVQDPMTTLRFHSLVKKTEESDRAVPWLWLLSNRHNSEAWHLLRRLCYNAFWLLIGVQIRPQGTDRTQLAKGIQKALSKGQSSS
jgi:hypothetical protein